MRKFLAILLTFSVMLAAGCSKNRAAEPFDGVMRLIVNVDCDNAYGLWAEYSLGGELLGGRDIRYADGGRIERGEQLCFDFADGDFPDVKALYEKVFGICFRVYGADGELLIPDIPEGWENTSEAYNGAVYTAAEELWGWHAESGGVYEFRLTDNGEGFYLFPMR